MTSNVLLRGAASVAVALAHALCTQSAATAEVSQPTSVQLPMGRRTKIDPARLRAKMRTQRSIEELSLEVWIERWLDERSRSRERTWKTDAANLQHAVQQLRDQYGRSLPLRALTPRHVAGLVDVLREERAPRTVRHVYAALKLCLQSALIEGHLDQNPCCLPPGYLPPNVDADGSWRLGARYRCDELEQIISDPRVPEHRRVLWALLGIAGVRISEGVGLYWSDVIQRPQPARLHGPWIPWELRTERQWDPQLRKMVPLKTRVIRPVPIHPVLETMLALWKRSYEDARGRKPEGDALIVLTEEGRGMDKWSAHYALELDCAELGWNFRSPHAFRRTFHDLVRDNGCDENILEQVTHAKKRTVREGYTATSWARLSAEMLKIKIRAPNQHVLLPSSHGQQTLFI